MNRTSFIKSVVKQLLLSLKITNPPIPEDKIAKALGLEIIYYPFPQEMSGLLVKDKELKAIGINQNQHPHRQRFSIAHEIGHYKLNHTDELFIDLFGLDYTDHKPANPNFEQEANQFAAELLIPYDMIIRDTKQTKDVKTLAKKYDVSEQAMLIRLLKLNLL